jgi:peptidyl-prolyl cis-trans isomerase B (cyclophilin B)
MFKRALSLAVFIIISATTFAQKYQAVLTTQYGKIVLELYDHTPKHKANFVKLCKKHFYDGTLFHRVIPGFMIQGGDPESKTAKPGQMLGNGDVGYTIPAEFRKEYFHQRGALAAARDNNPQKASSGCQFYIVQGKKFTETELKNIEKRTGYTFTPEQMKVYETIGGAPHLDGNYTVFGQVIKGMDIVDKIANQKRDKFDRPDTDQKILKLRVRKKFIFFWI